MCVNVEARMCDEVVHSRGPGGWEGGGGHNCRESSGSRKKVEMTVKTEELRGVKRCNHGDVAPHLMQSSAISPSGTKDTLAHCYPVVSSKHTPVSLVCKC